MGLDPLPISYEEGHPTKGPKKAGWQTTAAASGYAGYDFVEPCNIGILLGGKNNVTEIDLDSPDAVAVGCDLETGGAAGRSDVGHRDSGSVRFGRKCSSSSSNGAV